jgi:hypothetical protein
MSFWGILLMVVCTAVWLWADWRRPSTNKDGWFFALLLLINQLFEDE